jgi:hypothetical protein
MDRVDPAIPTKDPPDGEGPANHLIRDGLLRLPPPASVLDVETTGHDVGEP